MSGLLQKCLWWTAKSSVSSHWWLSMGFQCEQKISWQHSNLLSLLSYYWKYDSFFLYWKKANLHCSVKEGFLQIGFSSIQFNSSQDALLPSMSGEQCCQSVKGNSIQQLDEDKIYIYIKHSYWQIIYIIEWLIHGYNDPNFQAGKCNCNLLNLSKTFENLILWHYPLWENEKETEDGRGSWMTRRGLRQTNSEGKGGLNVVGMWQTVGEGTLTPTHILLAGSRCLTRLPRSHADVKPPWRKPGRFR